MKIRKTTRLEILALDPNVGVYPCHTNSATNVSGCPMAPSICSSPYGFGVYTYDPSIGYLTLVGSASSCSPSGQCNGVIKATGSDKFMLDAIYSFDPNRRYFCCCESSMGEVTVQMTLPAGTTLETLVKLRRQNDCCDAPGDSAKKPPKSSGKSSDSAKKKPKRKLRKS